MKDAPESSKVLVVEGRFPAALSGAHVGDPRCPATGGKGGECRCLEFQKGKR
jgi:hypothetical protein